MVILRDDDTCIDPIAQKIPGCFCHLPGGFACRHQNHFSGKGRACQRPDHCRIRKHSANRRRYNLFGLFSKCLGHRISP